MAKKWSLSGTYTEAGKRTNYKAFDYSEYLKSKNVYGNIILENDLEVSQSNYLNPIFIISNQIKNLITKNLEKTLGENSKIVKGILLGDISGIPEDISEEFRTSSIYHILAVSGTHVRTSLNWAYDIFF